MKKLLLNLLAAMLCCSASAQVQVKENLNRAPVAVKTSQGILVSWRCLGADGERDVRNTHRYAYVAQNLREEACVLERAQNEYVCRNTQGERPATTCRRSVYKPAAEVVHDYAAKHQEHIYGLSPSVENQGEHYEYGITHPARCRSLLTSGEMSVD